MVGWLAAFGFSGVTLQGKVRGWLVGGLIGSGFRRYCTRGKVRALVVGGLVGSGLCTLLRPSLCGLMSRVDALRFVGLAV